MLVEPTEIHLCKRVPAIGRCLVPGQRARRIGLGANAMLQEEAVGVLRFDVAVLRGALHQTQRLARTARHAVARVGAHAEHVFGFGVALARARDQLIERRLLRRGDERRGGKQQCECGLFDRARYSTVMRPSAMTFAHFAVSLFAYAVASSGELCRASMPASINFWRISGVPIALRNSALSRSTMAR